MSTTTKIIDDLMSDLLELDGFTRMDFEEEFPDMLPPAGTHRPLPLTEEERNEKGEAYHTYPLRLQHYKKTCYAEFESWNRRCLEDLSIADLGHIAWLFTKFSDESLKLMDEESGACFTAANFFFDAEKNLVMSNPR